MRALVHTTRLVVRWGDMDALGHVNNAAYLSYFEHARVEALERLGVTLGADSVLVVASASVVFKRPVVYPATVEVRVFVGAPGRSSFPTFYELAVVGEDALCATGEATVVQVEAATGRAARLPDGLRQALEARLTPPEAAR